MEKLTSFYTISCLCLPVVRMRLTVASGILSLNFRFKLAQLLLKCHFLIRIASLIDLRLNRLPLSFQALHFHFYILVGGHCHFLVTIRLRSFRRRSCSIFRAKWLCLYVCARLQVILRILRRFIDCGRANRANRMSALLRGIILLRFRHICTLCCKTLRRNSLYRSCHI